MCVPCGLRLAEKTQIAIVRHFGLQILEHVVKYVREQIFISYITLRDSLQVSRKEQSPGRKECFLEVITASWELSFRT